MAPKTLPPQDRAWLLQTGQRLPEQQDRVPRPSGKSTTEQARLIARALPMNEAARSSRSAGGLPQVPGAKAPAGALIGAALQYHRFSAERLMATGFEPQRQTVEVEGRPVQAASKASA
jgi:hypothetical protein